MSSTVIPVAQIDICIVQGATLNQTLYWETGDPLAPVNLTGYSALMQIRHKVDSEAVLLELTNTNGRITLGGALGSITIQLSATTTSSLKTSDNMAVYDLLMTGPAPSSVKTRIMSGNIILSPAISR